jgi:hypothetical protein
MTDLMDETLSAELEEAATPKGVDATEIPVKAEAVDPSVLRSVGMTTVYVRETCGTQILDSKFRRIPTKAKVRNRDEHEYRQLRTQNFEKHPTLWSN